MLCSLVDKLHRPKNKQRSDYVSVICWQHVVYVFCWQQSRADYEMRVVSGERQQPATDRTKRCSTSDVYGDNDPLRQHCELITDAFTRSFVIGL